MKFKLLALGKLKTPAYAALCADYAQRIQRYQGFELIEIPDERITDPQAREQILKKEADKLAKQIKPASYVIALDDAGKAWSSVELAEELKRLLSSPHREIVWVLGSAWGLSEDFKRQAQARWSLSRLTLPHQLARLVFLEQLYRGISILNHLPYHYE